ncbi:16S rRNA (uracil(1498)-N(3))-methyltransferase [Oceanobacillus senegalensis]|uniref:16S rRNA (uracil(1498)-N(3))-methyltransferase n=1 Tax=Oceanobacillus senegalensis TaxID=1936063 RepID=UPI000A30DA76|nr:16S rRNA (uracil(1498)-N(3))-methyltransferase [Oceanobacillus senegalensis]
MQRYFIPANFWEESNVHIEGDDVHHMTRVMRLTSGDQIICNHPNGEAAVCEILETSNNYVKAAILQWIEQHVELPVHVTIAQGIPKGDKFDLVLQKGTELGANAFIPLKSDRTIVVWDDKKAEKKVKRFKKIVKEASEQCHRNKIPEVKAPIGMSELLKESSEYDFKIIAYEEEAKTKKYHTFGSILSRMGNGQKILVCVGPEGGFTEEEIALLKDNNFHAVRLGPRILRSETAPLYALAAISYHFEEMG